jgi:hypothetical protein
MRSLIGMAFFLLAGCGTGGSVAEATGSGGQRSFAVGDFRAIELAGPYQVNVTVGGTPSVRAEGDEKLLEILEIRVEEGRLLIGTKAGSWNANGRATVHVTTAALDSADVAGSGGMEIGAFRSSQFSGRLAGSGNLVLAQIESDSVRFDIAGSGSVRASGRAGQSELDIAGSGGADLTGLASQDAKVSIAGSGDAGLRASGTVNGAIVGSGNVTVTGGARCSIEKMGSGQVHCG